MGLAISKVFLSMLLSPKEGTASQKLKFRITGIIYKKNADAVSYRIMEKSGKMPPLLSTKYYSA
jgi:hypothetical protein